jgi:hypothetical protein
MTQFARRSIGKNLKEPGQTCCKKMQVIKRQPNTTLIDLAGSYYMLLNGFLMLQNKHK